jgi:hypothetical protein
MGVPELRALSKPSSLKWISAIVFLPFFVINMIVCSSYIYDYSLFVNFLFKRKSVTIRKHNIFRGI